MRKFLLAAVAFGFLSVPLSAKAAAERLEFDKTHTQIFFVVNHLGFSNSTGRFMDFDGHVDFDQDHPSASDVDVTIKTDSLEMNDDAWNKHLKSGDFFNVEKFPEMTFKSTSIAVTGEKTADISGDLTILGVTKPVVLHTTYNKTDMHPFYHRKTSGFSATAHIKRSDFGMNYGLPMVGDDVDIRIEVEAYVPPPPHTEE